jgi:hypothetical protein
MTVLILIHKIRNVQLLSEELDPQVQPAPETLSEIWSILYFAQK